MSPGEKPARVLVVDDEADVRALVSRVLSERGYEVDQAASGRDALERLQVQRPDLMILDLMMPGVDGWEVLRQLKAMPDPPPVVIVTALGDYGALSRGIREGASAYVIKPFRFTELLAACQGVLASGDKTAPVHERRAGARRVLMAQVSVLNSDRKPITIGELVDVSEEGAQVRLGMPLAVDDQVNLAFHVPSGGSPLVLEGKVRWCNSGPRGYAHGLAFTPMNEQMEQQLKALLQRTGSSRQG